MTHYLICQVIYLFIHLLIHAFIHSIIRWFIHSNINSTETEIKKYAAEGHANLRYSIEGLQRGTEIEENCFEEALELAVGNNRGKAAGYLVLHGARNLERCMQAALLKPPLHKTAVLLLLCHAAKINDKELVKVICTGLFKENQKVGIVMKNDNVFTRNYLPKEWSNSMSRQKLNQLRYVWQ